VNQASRYVSQQLMGVAGEYRLYAVKLPTLADAPGFPISLEGHNANNDNTRYFVGGTVLQRPGLAFVGNSIVAGFGGHCDEFNYTGMLVAASKTSGVGVTNIQAMVARPGTSPPPVLGLGPAWLTYIHRCTVSPAHGHYRPRWRQSSYLARGNGSRR